VARVKERSSNLVGRCAFPYRFLQLTDCGALKLEQACAFFRVGLLDRRLLLRRSMGRYERHGCADRNEEYDDEDARRWPDGNTRIRARVHHRTPVASLWPTIVGRCTPAKPVL
jgi:hypothetical protein